MPGQDPRAAHPEDEDQREAPAAPVSPASGRDGEPGGNGPSKRSEWEGYSAAVLNDLLDG
jgi:hypothetical protein